jgi:hypothetical protein
MSKVVPASKSTVEPEELRYVYCHVPLRKLFTLTCERVDPVEKQGIGSSKNDNANAGNQ